MPGTARSAAVLALQSGRPPFPLPADLPAVPLQFGGVPGAVELLVVLLVLLLLLVPVLVAAAAAACVVFLRDDADGSDSTEDRVDGSDPAETGTDGSDSTEDRADGSESTEDRVDGSGRHHEEDTHEPTSADPSRDRE